MISMSTEGGPMLNSLKFQLLLVVSLFNPSTFAAGSDAQRLAVSQGVSSADSSTLINWRSGFTFQNPSAVAQLNSPQISLQYDTNEDTDDKGLGAELGFGNGTLGIGVGVYKRDCTNCEESTGVVIGYNSGSWSFGIGLREDDQYSVGLNFEISGPHQLGFVFDTLNSDLNTEDVDSYGLGYRFEGSGFLFALDASKRADKDNNTNDDIIQITPGILIETNQFALSVSYDSYTNDDNDTYEDEAWIGLGYNANEWNLNLYKDFIGDWALNFVYRF